MKCGWNRLGMHFWTSSAVDVGIQKQYAFKKCSCGFNDQIQFNNMGL